MDDVDEEVQVVPEIAGWGMTLPNSPVIAICSGPARAAFILGADPGWFADARPYGPRAPDGAPADGAGATTY